MKRPLILLTAIVLASSITSYGKITDVLYGDDGDGALSCSAIYTYETTDQDVVDLLMNGQQNWGPAHLNATLTADTLADPSSVIYNIVDNNTATAWDGYIVNLTMNVPFTISMPQVVPADWSYAITPPVMVGSDYVGQVAYTAGTLIPVGGQLEIGFRVDFSGATIYTLEQELIPHPVPEPTALGLLGMGALLAFRRRPAR